MILVCIWVDGDQQMLGILVFFWDIQVYLIQDMGGEVEFEEWDWVRSWSGICQ